MWPYRSIRLWFILGVPMPPWWGGFERRATINPLGLVYRFERPGMGQGDGVGEDPVRLQPVPDFRRRPEMKFKSGPYLIRTGR